MDIVISIHPLRWIRSKINKLITFVLKRKLGTNMVTCLGRYKSKLYNYRYWYLNVWDIVYPTDSHMGIVVVCGHMWRFEYEGKAG